MGPLLFSGQNELPGRMHMGQKAAQRGSEVQEEAETKSFSIKMLFAFYPVCACS